MKHLTFEIARLLDITPNGVRYREQRGLLVADRTSSGKRIFDDEHPVNRAAIEQAAAKRVSVTQ